MVDVHVAVGDQFWMPMLNGPRELFRVTSVAPLKDGAAYIQMNLVARTHEFRDGEVYATEKVLASQISGEWSAAEQLAFRRDLA